MKRFLSVLTFLGGLAVAAGAQANLVGVDFGSTPNPTPQNWTASDGSSSLTNLQDDTGRTTSVGLSFSSRPSFFNAIALSSSVPSYTYDLSNISNNIYSFGGSLTMTLSGLTPGQSYPVYVFGLRGGSSYTQNISLIGSNTVTYTQAASANELTINDQVGTNSSNLSAYAKTVTADSSGNIQVVISGGYYLAGLAIDVPAYTVGGSVTGLASGQSVVLLNNAGNSTTVNSNTSFTFSTAINSGSSYAVTVGTQPTGQTCTVTNGSGTASANVTTVAVSCTTNTYTVGGTVTGLAAGQTLTLLNNAGNSTTLNANGSFTFTNAVNHGSAYAVTVGTQPTGQTCTVTNGTGTASANVSNVTVTCNDNPVQPIPTLGEWAMIFMASLMAMFGIRRMRSSK